MDGRTCVCHAIRRQPLDRVPRYDAFWEDTLSLWRTQGMTPDVTPEELFDFDLRMMAIDASMRRPQQVLRTDDSFVTFQDRAGYTARKFLGKTATDATLKLALSEQSTPASLDCP